MTASRGLLEAARALLNEVRGFLGCAELEMRQAVGNTNVAVLKHWADECEKAISAEQARGEEQREPCPCARRCPVNHVHHDEKAPAPTHYHGGAACHGEGCADDAQKKEEGR